jgi:hypothetical protein
MGGGVDQENVAAGDALFDVRFVDLFGRIVLEAADDGAFAHEFPPNISVPPLEEGPLSPRTRASKSVSPLLPFVSRLELGRPPNDMKSFRDAEIVLLFAPNSCNFLVWSFSTFVETVLMRVMYD